MRKFAGSAVPTETLLCLAVLEVLRLEGKAKEVERLRQENVWLEAQFAVAREVVHHASTVAEDGRATAKDHAALLERTTAWKRRFASLGPARRKLVERVLRWVLEG